MAVHDVDGVVDVQRDPDEQGISVIGNQPCQPVGDPQATPSRGQQHDAAVRGDPAAVEISDDLLVSTPLECFSKLPVEISSVRGGDQPLI